MKNKKSKNTNKSKRENGETINDENEKNIVLSITLIIGIMLGGAGVSYFLLDIYSHSLIIENKINRRHNIISPYVILTHLHKNDTRAVIEMQENELDSGLFIFASEKKQDWTDDNRLMLKKIRAYRTKYPRKSKIPEFDKAINDLLFSK
ncbi:MAG: hypothetical protein KOO69_05975 [Victivallales bacterium]|nr:hypothetical protein [Victivallales bacterium]